MSSFRPDLLQGQRAVVTGGGSGIGLAIAQAFAAHGASVHLVGRTEARLRAAAATMPGAATWTALDVRDADGVEALAGTLRATGPTAILVNAAAGNFPTPFAAMSRNAWRSVVDIVLDGTANTCRSFQRDLAGGCILNVVAGYAWTGAPGVSHSGAAKAGVLNLTRSLAVEWAPTIRVNALSPGPVDGTEGMRRLGDELGLRSAVESAVPLQRMARLEEMAQAALYLCSPAASYVTGACLVADGGMDAKGPFGGLLLGS